MSLSGNTRRAIAMAALLAALCGCSTMKGWFTDDKKAAEKKATEPMELVDITPSINVRKLWSVDLGKGEKHLGTFQNPAVADGHVYAAAIKGGVHALDLKTGSSLWEYKTDERVSTVGVGEGLVVVGTLSGKVIALDPATGTEKWQAKAHNEVIAPPVLGQGLVVVHSNDGQVLAFDPASGARKWVWDHDQPSLTVRGVGAVLLAPGVAFVGNDDGTLSALSLQDGHELWTQPIAEPEGRTELERMADVDSTPLLDGSTLFVSSYKKQTLAIDGPSGRPIWSRDNGGVGGLSLGGAAVLLSDRDGAVWALDKGSGGSLWSNQTLLRRNLTAPAVQGDYVVVGDYKGYVHWLKLDDGQVVARERLDRHAIHAQPVVADGVALVQSTDGKLVAYGLQ
ncbi:MAG: outer membrane protein assembly factor BamB [Pseudoxanthomonas sp.]